MGADYAALYLEKTPGGLVLSQSDCANADKGAAERVNGAVKLTNGEVFLMVHIEKNQRCTFFYSVDGKKYESLGKSFTAQSGRWIGAKIGLFCQRPKPFNDGGWVDVDYFTIENAI
jgi:hypothetical protein